MSDLEQEFTPTKDWKPIPRISRTIPFGYRVDPDDNKILLPNVFELEALEKARGYLKRFSYRAVSEWLENVTGRKLSYVGLKKRLEAESARQRRASSTEYWARRYKEAEEKARSLKERPGATNSGGDGS